MNIPISVAKRDLEDLVRRAQAGEDVVIEQDGVPIARLQGVETDRPKTWNSMTPDERFVKLKALLDALPMPPDDGVSAARSQDFLYGDDGLPG